VRDLPTGTVTFLFTDIEGSTRLLGETGQAYEHLLGMHKKLLIRAFTDHHGTIVGTEGDSFFVAFARAGDGLRAAVEAQRYLYEHEWPGGLDVRVRMGLHTGEGRVVDDDQYVGMDVHRAARIAAIGHGGQVLMSETTMGLTRDALPREVGVRDLGEHRLKDFERPERIFQLDIEGLLHDFPALKTVALEIPPFPQPLSSFVGRERETTAVVSLLEEEATRLLTLTGPGGVGKTRLALEVAEDARPGFADGAAIVLLADVSSADSVVSAILAQLRVPEVGARTAMDALRKYLRGRHLLLILDNFEHVVSAAPVIGQLLQDSPRLKVLVTSREMLHLAGEREFAVPPLGLSPTDDLRAISESEAVQLFAARAQAVQANFSLNDENAWAIAEICRLVDGLPLGIELAAARIRLLTPEAIRERLLKSLDLLAGGPRDLPTRQRALHSTIDWSYQLLEPPDRYMFERLALFEGGWSIAAVEELFVSPDIPDPFQSLSSLLDKSLVVRQQQSRFSMLRSVREFGLQRLSENADLTKLRDIHADFYLRYAEEAARALRTDQQAFWIEGLRSDYANVRAAIEWSFERNRPEYVVRLGWALWIYWWVEGRYDEGRAWMERALTAQLSPEHQGAASVVLGILAFGKGELDQAASVLRRGLELCDQTGNDFGSGLALAMLGVIAGLSNPAAVREPMNQSLERFVRIGDDWGIGFAHLVLGRVLVAGRQYQEAGEVLTKAVDRLRSVGEKTLLSLSMLNLGRASLGMQRIEEAASILVEALDLIEEVKDRQTAARVLEALAATAGAAGDAERGALLFGAAESARRSISADVWVPDRSTHEETEARLRQTLGAQRFESLWRDGLRLSVANGLDLAQHLRSAQ
jgi:predicted ATPase/class 3 adenylate cyclase